MTTYKRPESVLVVVYTEQAETLLLHRIVPPVGIWQSVTGSLRWGESAELAAQRELQEETGIQGMPVATGASYSYDIVKESLPLYAPGVVQNHEAVFEYCLPQQLDIRLDPQEHSDYCWLSLSDAAERVWSWSNQKALNSLIERLDTNS